MIAIHGLYGRNDSSWTQINWKDEILPSSTRHIRLSLFTYDVFGSSGGVLTRNGAKDEATKLLDSLLELRRKDSEVGAWPFLTRIPILICAPRGFLLLSLGTMSVARSLLK